MVRVWIYVTVFVVLADIASSLVNTTVDEVKKNNFDLKGVKTRRKSGNKNHRSTSSSSGEKEEKKFDDDEKSADDSLDMTSSPSDSSEDKSKSRRGTKKYVPKSTEERKGWRKWHRKCTPCPEEARKKWRDPSINWICGGYQRARRSFKSPCMMRLRNCQDGTMFVKIHDHRCANDTGRGPRPHGDHWFYDYKVSWSLSSDRKDRSSSVSESGSEDSNRDGLWSSSKEWRRANVRNRIKHANTTN